MDKSLKKSFFGAYFNEEIAFQGRG